MVFVAAGGGRARRALLVAAMEMKRLRAMESLDEDVTLMDFGTRVFLRLSEGDARQARFVMRKAGVASAFTKMFAGISALC